MIKKVLFLFLTISIVSCKKSEKKVFSQDTTYIGQTKQFADTYIEFSILKLN